MKQLQNWRNKINVIERKFSKHELRNLKDKFNRAVPETKLEAADQDNLNLKHQCCHLLHRDTSKYVTGIQNAHACTHTHT